MVATFRWKVYTSTNAATESPDAAPGTSAATLNLMQTDAYDAATDYQSYPTSVPAAGTNYTYERWFRAHFSGTFNLIDNMKIWKSAGTLSDGNLVLNAGITTSGVTPINTVSSLATSAIPTVVGSALDPTPAAPLTSAGYSKYCVMQLAVPSTVTTPGDISSQTITFRYDEQ
uniref:Uncharacterized protein n=1 Tax=viral metagenome TaxID=1070528 RepID=A0A6M3IJL6_9ZZZZ